MEVVLVVGVHAEPGATAASAVGPDARAKPTNASRTMAAKVTVRLKAQDVLTLS